MPRALIIEDETTARADLRAKLAAHPDVEIVGEAATVRSARERLAAQDYTLVFLDVHLIGGNAFDLVANVRAGARIIFVTAHDAYALRAFEINAVDYLLKPIEPARLAESLRRIGGAAENPPPPLAEEFAATEREPALRPDDRVYLRAGLTARFAPVAEISVITACDNYTEVALADGTKLLVRKSLKAWENSLPPTHFMRVHRTGIVNLARVTRFERDRDEHTHLYLQGAAQPVAASRDRWSDVRARLERLHPAK